MLKLFPKHYATNNGIMIACCPHEVVYGFKFLTRSEGSRDVLDLLRSFRVMPRVVIYDNAENLAAHIRKTLGDDFLGPLNGRICAPTAENVAMIERCIAHGKLPFPVQPTSRLVLFDEFHYAQARSMRDKCRYPALLKQKINTQAAEHINSAMKRKLAQRSQMDWQLHWLDVLLCFSDWNEGKNHQMALRLNTASFRNSVPITNIANVGNDEFEDDEILEEDSDSEFNDSD
jgi:hypothetical protein